MESQIPSSFQTSRVAGMSENDVIASVSGGDDTNPVRPATRRYGFACTSCKSRKVRCAGDRLPALWDNCIWPVKNYTQSSRRSREPTRNPSAAARQRTSTTSKQPTPYTKRNHEQLLDDGRSNITRSGNGESHNGQANPLTTALIANTPTLTSITVQGKGVDMIMLPLLFLETAPLHSLG